MAAVRTFVRGMLRCCQDDAELASHYADDLQVLAELSTLPLWQKASKHPGFSIEKKQAVIVSLLPIAAARDAFRVLSLLLLRHGLLEAAADIRAVFLERLAEVNREAIVHLELAMVELAENSQIIDAIRRVVCKAFACEHVHLRIATNAQLIAGFRASWGYRVLDASARWQLANIRHKLLYT